MNNKYEKIIEQAKNFSPTIKEKGQILNQVSLHIKENPIGSFGGSMPSPYETVIKDSSPRHSLYNNPWSKLFTLSVIKQYKLMPVLILFMVLIGGGTSLAANSALPGDGLYPIKIHINEPVKSLLAFNADANVKVQAEIANERLNEIEKLSLKGEISTETKNAVKENFNEHAENVKTLVAKIEAKGDVNTAAKISSDFESSLNAHNSILSELSNNDPKNQEKIDEINTEVNIHLKETTDTRSEGEKKIASSTDNVKVKTSAGNSLTSATNKIEEVEKYILNKKDIDADAKAEVNERLNVAKDLIIQGNAKLESGSSGDAYILFQKAFRTAQKAKLVLNSEKELKINVRNILNKEKNKDKEDNSSNSKSGENSSESNVNVDVKTDVNTKNVNEKDSSTEAGVESQLRLKGSVKMGL